MFPLERICSNIRFISSAEAPPNWDCVGADCFPTAAIISSQLLSRISVTSASYFLPRLPRLFFIPFATSSFRRLILVVTTFQSTSSLLVRYSLISENWNLFMRSRITTISSCLALKIKNITR